MDEEKEERLSGYVGCVRGGAWNLREVQRGVRNIKLGAERGDELYSMLVFFLFIQSRI